MLVPKTILVGLAALALMGLVVAAAIVPASASDRSALAGGVQVVPQHVGDALRYERAWTYEGESFRSDVLVTLTGPSSATDAFGIPRDVDTSTVAIRGPQSDADYRCSFLQGSTALVRRDLQAGTHVVMMTGHWKGIPLTDGYTRMSTQTLNLMASFDDPCAGRHALSGATLRVDEELSLVEALGGAIVIADAPGIRAKGEATQWEGRDAMRFTFTNEDARIVAIWADGLPGVAHLEVTGIQVHTERSWIGPIESPFTMTLRGIEPGAGPELASGEARVPERNPAAGFVAASPFLVDDTAFAPAYPFEAALAALRADPATCARELLARPDAIVWRAEWDADARDHIARDAPALGGWTLDIVAGSDACSAYTVRLQPHALLPPVTRNYDQEGPVPVITSAEREPVVPAEVIDAATMTNIVQLGGFEATSARNVVWTLTTRSDVPMVHVSVKQVGPDPPEVSSKQSRAVGIIATTGALDAIMMAENEVDASPLPIGSAAMAMPPYQRSALGAFGGPSVGQGIAAAGLLGLALLVAKFLLVPLYSRLRRATLLDNPVRARLYEAVRRDPGVHRAALIEFAGVGVGATTRHLRQLVAHRYLVEMRDGAFARYYAAGEVPPEVARRDATLRAGSLREVYELYRAEPALTLREAGARLGMSAPSVYRAKQRLVKDGLLPAAPEATVVEA